jgi:hypothetical protein
MDQPVCGQTPKRELMIVVQLTVADYRDEPPTERDIRNYIDTSLTECEYHESDWHVHGARVTGWGPQGSTRTVTDISTEAV